MSVINLKQKYQITRIAQITQKDVQMMVNDGSGFGPKELGEAGWMIVSTFIGPGLTPHGVGQYVYGVWQQTFD